MIVQRRWWLFRSLWPRQRNLYTNILMTICEKLATGYTLARNEARLFFRDSENWLFDAQNISELFTRTLRGWSTVICLQKSESYFSKEKKYSSFLHSKESFHLHYRSGTHRCHSPIHLDAQNYAYCRCQCQDVLFEPKRQRPRCVQSSNTALSRWTSRLEPLQQTLSIFSLHLRMSNSPVLRS